MIPAGRAVRCGCLRVSPHGVKWQVYPSAETHFSQMPKGGFGFVYVCKEGAGVQLALPHAGVHQIRSLQERKGYRTGKKQRVFLARRYFK